MKRIADPAVAIVEFSKRRFSKSSVTTDGNGLYEEKLSPDAFADRIISDVISKGDAALLHISEKIDGCELGFFEIPQDSIESAADSLTPENRNAIDLACERVRRFQETAKPNSWEDPSKEFGEIVSPVDSVAAYVPGGSASLVSTVIMCVVPAKVAGVPNVFVSTPASGDRLPQDEILYAAHAAGADRVFKLGGAQAIAGFAYGTESIPKVDVVCGPGNVFVTAAKRAVVGDVGIDGLNGPTETAIVADWSANPSWVAADLIAQAEHDTLASPFLIAFSGDFADEVDREIEGQLTYLPRSAVARAAIENNGYSVIVKSHEEAQAVVAAAAPEHLSVVLRECGDPVKWAKSVGGLFLGEYSPEVICDYVAGPSHVMPTGRTARFASALSVRTFLRFTPFINLPQARFEEIAPVAVNLARMEKLEGHARAAGIRIRPSGDSG